MAKFLESVGARFNKGTLNLCKKIEGAFGKRNGLKCRGYLVLW